MAPSEGGVDQREAERRLKVRMARLVREYGQEAVVNRIAAHRVPRELEAVKNWLVLTAWAASDRERSGTV